jgi:hypothetical protein
MFKKVVNYFDKLEDRIRGRLSRYPILYTLIGGTGIVLFWRGVWVTADEIFLLLPLELQWLNGPLSIIISTFVLLLTGLFVSFFVADNILLSGMKQEKKLIEKTEAEIREDTSMLHKIEQKIDTIQKDIDDIQTHR